MPRITFNGPDGQSVVVDAPEGVSLMVAAITNGIDRIEAECGGAMACGTCHVYVEPHPFPLPAMSEEEDAMLDAIEGERRPCSRLACQILLSCEQDGLVVTTPDRQG